ncbi:unnamed protein product [Brassica rapa subsp. narinosa]
MENGNLRLQDNRNNGEILWESFKHPYSSMLPRMSLGINNGTGENTGLTSWRSYTDPSTGNYTVGLVAFPFPELLIWKNKVPQWRSGPWNGQVFIGLPDMDSLLNIDGFNLNNDNQGTVLLTFANDSFLYHFNLDPNGAIYQRDWSTSMNDWRVGVRFPSTDCDEYNRCGPYGSCNYREDPQCKCIKGFVPRNNTEWSLGNWISGCVRRAPLRCERVKNGSSNGGKEDWFLKVQKMKVPVNVQPSLANAQACPKVCLDNCSCTAYAYDQGIGCMLWSGNLVDMQSFLGSGIDLYIRLSHSELKAHSKRAVMITALVLGIVFVSAVCVLLACLKLKKRPGEPKKDRSVEQLLKRMEEVNSGDEAASNQVWTLWNEGEAASLADPNVFDESFEKEITKCVQISLLCVQEVANDRPNVSTVIWMLTTENMDLPEPKQPAFITRREKSEGESSDQSSQKESINDVSLTSVTGR